MVHKYINSIGDKRRIRCLQSLPSHTAWCSTAQAFIFTLFLSHATLCMHVFVCVCVCVCESVHARLPICSHAFKCLCVCMCLC